MLLGFKSEGVHVNASSRNVSVVLVRLNKVEVRTKAFLEAVVTVKLELSTDDRVATSVAGGKASVVSTATSAVVGSEVSGGISGGHSTGAKASREVEAGVEESFDFGSGAVNVASLEHSGNIREGLSHVTSFNVGQDALVTAWDTVTPRSPEAVDVIVVSVVSPLVDVGGNNGVTLDNPDKFLNRVVKVELDLDVGVDSGFVTGELELFNEVFVRALGKTSALVGVEVDVVNEESGRLERRNTEELVATAGERNTAA